MKNIVALLLLLFTPYCMAGDDLHVSDAWMRHPAPGAKMTAAYMKVMNKGKQSVSLTSASSETFGRIEIHRTVMEGGMMKMAQTAAVEIPAGATVEFKPKGLHMMPMMPKREIMLGDKITITLGFDNGQHINMTFVVKKGGMQGMGGMKH